MKSLNRKHTLTIRPIEKLLSSPHLLAGFLGFHENYSWKISDGKAEFLRNPVLILNDLYYYLNLEDVENKLPCDKIWDHDKLILNNAISFYEKIENLIGKNEKFSDLEKIFSKTESPNSEKISNELWGKCRASHKGFQVGMELLLMLPKVGILSKFYELGIDDELGAIIPQQFLEETSREKFIKFLSPPPKAKSDEIVAPMGGMFYSKEAPNLPELIKVGDSFSAGQPLFIIEVMKMFNKISVPFSGKIIQSLMENSDGKIVTKGQTLFKVEPDEVVKEETEEEIIQRKKKVTLELLG